MFYYLSRKFLTWTAVFTLFLGLVLTASVYLQAFVSYQPLPLRLVLVVAALQLTDSLRFACCLAGFCLAAGAVGSRHIMLIRSTGGGARTVLLPVLMASVTVAGFCAFFDGTASPPLRRRLFGAERDALVRQFTAGMARTGQARIGEAAFTAERVRGDTAHAPLCFVGDLLVRGETLTADRDRAVVSGAEIRDVHGGETFRAGSFVIRFPSDRIPKNASEWWLRRPWRAYRSMAGAVSVVPLALLGFIAGILVGRLGQMKAFLLLLFLAFVLYLGGEKGMLDLAKHQLGVAGGWVAYTWGITVTAAGWPLALRAVRSRAALGTEG
jgi:hypothetical protein